MGPYPGSDRLTSNRAGRPETSSKDDEAVCTWISPLAQGLEDLARAERKAWSEQRQGSSEQRSIALGVGHEKDHAVYVAVSLLEVNCPLQRLKVGWSRLRLNPNTDRTFKA
jgi:hypothetical protein